MGTLDQLQSQNHEIEELCQVLTVLIKDTTVCNTQICHNLFDQFCTTVKDHLTLEDSALYAHMLGHKNQEMKLLAGRFKENSREIKKIFLQYEKQWCKKGAKEQNRDRFIEETTDIFKLIMKRIDAETHEFFPKAKLALTA